MTHRIVEDFQDLDGHIVVERDGDLAILDTGTPFSMDAPSIASEQLGRPIARLIGCDEMAGHTLEVDWSAKRLTWSPSRPAPEDAVPLEMSVFGVPLMDIRGPDGVVQAVFDTGAPIAYVPNELVANRKAIREREDFFPGLGEFSTSVYSVAIEVGKVSFSLECGVLPPLLAMALGLLCPSGYIVGSQLMQGRITRFDLDAQWIQLDGGPS